MASAAPALSSGVFGALFFLTIFGVTVIDPRQVRWVFVQGDWQWHFLGWHFFRNEPWQVPPGRIVNYIEPLGSALAYTDSIPLMAFILKPFAALLPNPMQYLGVWLLICFSLQGVFGAILVGSWTRNATTAFLGGCLFVLAPTLLVRYFHPSLCAHWLILWALWLAMREPRPMLARTAGQHAAAAALSGLVHPYLMVMTLTLITAAAIKRALVFGRRAVGESLALAITGAAAAGAAAWMSGLLGGSATQDLQDTGFGLFSMNLLALINPGPHSRFVRELPWFAAEQSHEGFQYLGLAPLLCCAIALASAVRKREGPTVSSLPLLLTLTGFAMFSFSPRVTLGDRVLVDLMPYFGDSSTFRASARFFWPVSYGMLAAAIGVIGRASHRRLANAMLVVAVSLQLVELQPWYARLRVAFRSPEFHGVHLVTPSDEWSPLLPQFRRMRMYSPQVCGGPLPVPTALAGYLAGLYGLALNDGFAARLDAARVSAACERLEAEFVAGTVDDTTVYLVAPSLLAQFEARAPVACRRIDAVPVCISKAAAGHLSLPWPH